MQNCDLYVYTDERNIIHHIKYEYDSILVEQFNLTIIEKEKVFTLKKDVNKFNRAGPKETVILSKVNNSYRITNIFFIYYDNENIIQCISPFKNNDMEKIYNEGLSALTETLCGIIEGSENLLNYRVRDIGNGYIELNRILINVIKLFGDSIERIGMYKVSSDVDYPHIILVYNKKQKTIYLKEMIDIHQDKMSVLPIHVVNKTDKSIIYRTIVFNFEKEEHDDVKSVADIPCNDLDFYIIHDYRLLIEEIYDDNDDTTR